jgi:hypothetical protein
MQSIHSIKEHCLAKTNPNLYQRFDFKLLDEAAHENAIKDVLSTFLSMVGDP